MNVFIKKANKIVLQFVLYSIGALVIVAAFWYGMNKQLCAGGYSQAEYNQMQLTCPK